TMMTAGTIFGSKFAAASGVYHKVTWSDFAASLAFSRTDGRPLTKETAPLFIPGRTSDGTRRDASVLELYQLILDSDTGAPWDKLKALLDADGSAYVFYETLSSTAELVKWRCCLPLAAPFDTSTPLGQERWKHGYVAAATEIGR